MKKTITRHIPFGLHVMLDMYDCSPEVLNDPGLVTNILQTLPEQLGMRILMGPFVSFAQPNGKRDPGDGRALLSSKNRIFRYTPLLSEDLSQ